MRTRTTMHAMYLALAAGAVGAALGGCELVLGTDLTERAVVGDSGPDGTALTDGSAEQDGSPSASDGSTSPEGDASDGGLDAPRPLTGKEVTYSVTDTTTTSVNTDFTGVTLGAYVLEADGGTTFYPGTDNGDGTFTVPNVPEGVAYSMQFQPLAGTNIPLYGFSTSRTIDQSIYGYGRPNIDYTDWGDDASAVTTTVSYDITNVDPALTVNQAADSVFTVLSIGGGAEWTIGSATDPYTGDPTANITWGTTTITGTEPFYGGTPLIDGTTYGDLTYLAGYIGLLDAGVDPSLSPPLVLAQYLRTDTFDMTAGQTETLSGAMTTPAAATLDGGPMTLAWDVPGFAQIVGQISASGSPSYAQINIGVAPQANLAGPGGINLYQETLPAAALGVAGVDPIDTHYADIAPASWVATVQVLYLEQTNLSYPVPDGGSVPVWTDGFIICNYLLSDVLGTTLEPTVGPPTNISIDGQTADEPHSGVGLEPVVAWEPPTLGTATSYNISIKDFGDGPQPIDPPNVVAQITTSAAITSFKVLPGILETGHTYIFSISTRQAVADQPQIVGTPGCFTNSTSAMFQP